MHKSIVQRKLNKKWKKLIAIEIKDHEDKLKAVRRFIYTLQKLDLMWRIDNWSGKRYEYDPLYSLEWKLKHKHEENMDKLLCNKLKRRCTWIQKNDIDQLKEDIRLLNRHQAQMRRYNNEQRN